MGRETRLIQSQETIRAVWESRSRKYRTAIEGVMHKSFPRVVNELLHAWQLDQLLALIPPGTELQMLDVGCGYGRLARVIRHHRPNVQAVGLDLAYHYAWLFTHNGPCCNAVQGQVLRIPFPAERFDFVIAAVVLEYVAAQALPHALREMLRVLKPDGQCVLITEEPAGRWIWTLGGILDAVGQLAGCGGGPENVWFTALSVDLLREQVATAGGRVLQQIGCPALTLALPLLIPIARLCPGWIQPLARACLRLDRRMGQWPRPSIYTISVIAKAR